MDPISRKAASHPFRGELTHPAIPTSGQPLTKGTAPVSLPFPAGQETDLDGASQRVQLVRRMSLNQLTTLRNSLAEDLSLYARHGVAGIGLNWRKLSDTGIRRSVRQIQNSRLPVSSLGWIGGFTGEHGYALREVMTEARRVIRVAGQVGAKTVTVLSGPQAGHIRSHAMRLVTDGLRELSELAATYQVRLALQPMHPLFAKNWSFLNSLDDTLDVLDRIRNHDVKLVFGAYHLFEEPRLADRLAEIVPRIGLVTLADCGETPRHENDRLLPGEGQLPLVELIHVLETHNYSGWYELEVWSRDLWKLGSRDLMRRCVAAQDRLSAQFAAS